MGKKRKVEGYFKIGEKVRITKIFRYTWGESKIAEVLSFDKDIVKTYRKRDWGYDPNTSKYGQLDNNEEFKYDELAKILKKYKEQEIETFSSGIRRIAGIQEAGSHWEPLNKYKVDGMFLKKNKCRENQKFRRMQTLKYAIALKDKKPEHYNYLLLMSKVNRYNFQRQKRYYNLLRKLDPTNRKDMIIVGKLLAIKFDFIEDCLFELLDIDKNSKDGRTIVAKMVMNKLKKK